MAGTIQKALLNDGVVITFITLKMGGPNALWRIGNPELMVTLGPLAAKQRQLQGNYNRKALTALPLYFCAFLAEVAASGHLPRIWR